MTDPNVFGTSRSGVALHARIHVARHLTHDRMSFIAFIYQTLHARGARSAVQINLLLFRRTESIYIASRGLL